MAMIVKGSQRSGGRALAAHLLNQQDNDHIEVHHVDGFSSEDVTGAFLEIEAMSRATRCKQPFFSVSISPPKGETVVNADFEAAIAQVADTMGLSKQPRVVIFHEKEARRHCHVVFNRIDAVEIKAINLPFYKKRLTEISRELYLTHGFAMPSGLSDKSLANPLNFGLEEWQVAKRAKRDPREIKAALKHCWVQSDSGAAFAAALKERGFWLCRGDRRGFVALDYQGNVYSLSRWLDVKSKDIKARLGEPERLASVDDAKADIAATMSSAAKRLLADMERKQAEAMKPLLAQRQRIVDRQRAERQELRQKQQMRRETRTLAHAQRFRRGLKGLWDWVTGRQKDIKRALQAEIEQAAVCDDAERHSQRLHHREERQVLQSKIEAQRLNCENERSQMESLFKDGTDLLPEHKDVPTLSGQSNIRHEDVYSHNHPEEHSL